MGAKGAGQMDEEKLQMLTESLSQIYFQLPFLHRARFNPRLRTTGGRYLLKSHNIEINKKYYDVYGMEELEQIIKHELCHYHLHLHQLPYKHKDRVFQSLLKKVGAKMHCPPLPSQKKENAFRYLYQCRDCGQKFFRKRKVDLSKYCCGRCRGILICKKEWK